MRKHIGHLIRNFGFLFSLFIIRILPLRLLMPLGRWIGESYFWIARRYRLVGEKAIQWCLGVNAGEAQSILRKSFRLFGEGTILSGRTPVIRTTQIEKLITLTGEEHLRPLQESGRGAFILTGHFGPFTLIGSRLSHAGFPSGYIIRLSREHRIRNSFIRKGLQGKFHLIPSRPYLPCMREVTQAIRNGEFIVVPIDHPVHSRGVPAPVLGQQLKFETGAIALALKYDIPLIPARIMRKEHGYRLTISPPIPVSPGDSKEEVVRRIADFLSQNIQEHPEHWLWSPDRWQKLLPPEELPFPIVRGFPKRAGHYLGWRAVQGAVRFAQVIPLRLIIPLGRLIGKLAFHLAGKRRTIAAANLNLAFGKEKSEEEIRNFTREFFAQVGQGALSLFAYPRLFERIRITGEEHLQSALARKRGSILISGHVSVFPLIIYALGKRDYPINTFLRFPRDPRLGRYVIGHIENMGGHYLPVSPPRRSLRLVHDCLSRNELIIMYIDQNVHKGGEFIPFFGHPAATSTLPASLALRNGVPILPAFIRPDGDAGHKPDFSVTIGSPLDITPSGDPKQDRIRILTHLNHLVEEEIRKAPPIWFWFHRRWKRAHQAGSGGVVFRF